MGAWNYGIFDDDSACDFASELVESNNPLEIFEKSFATALGSDYLEYDECHAVLVSSAFIDMLSNGTSYDADEGILEKFITDHQAIQITEELATQAQKSLQRVLGDNSELHELWAENIELYPKWKQNIVDLIERLQRRNKKSTS